MDKPQPVKGIADLKSANRALTALSLCNEAVFRATDELGLLREVCEVLTDAGEYAMAWAGVKRGDGVVAPVVASGDRGYLEQVTIRYDDSPEGCGPTGVAIRERRPAFVNSESDASFCPWADKAREHGFRAAASLPIEVNDELHSVLVIYSVSRDAFDEPELDLLTRLARNVAFGLRTLEDRRLQTQAMEFLRTLYSASPDMIFIHGRDGRVLDVNDNTLRRYGFTREEALAAPFEVFHDQSSNDVAQAAALLERALAGEPVDFEWMAKDSEGNAFPVEVRLRRLQENPGAEEPAVMAVVRDITERREAKRALTESEQRYRALIEQASDAILIARADGHFVDVNHQAEELLGYSRKELLERTPFDIHPEREHETVEAAFEAMQRNGRSLAEHTALRRDGTETLVEVAGTEITVGGQKLYLGTFRDITVRKAAEVALRQKTEELNERVKQLNCLYQISRCMVQNEADLEPLLREIIRLTPQGFRYPERLGVRLDCYGKALEGPLRPEQPLPFELRVGGEVIGTLEVGYAEGPDEPPALLREESELAQAVADKLERLFERRDAAEKLRRSEANLKRAQWIAKLGSWEWNVDDGSLFCSEVAYRIIGLPLGTPLDTESVLARVHDSDRRKLEATVQDAIVANQDFDLDFRLTGEDGAELVLHAEGEVVTDESGRVLKVEGTVQDMTERQNAENRLRKSYAELNAAHEKMKQMNAQLIQSEKMASIGQLAAGVAHEINNPVGYISANVGSLQGYMDDLFELLGLYEQAESAGPDDAIYQQIQATKARIDLPFLSADAGELIVETMEGVNRVKGIVQDLKDFSRSDEEEWQWSDLHKGLDSTLNIVWNELKYKAEVNKEYGELPEVQCMPSQLNQVFMNLLVNAGQAIEDRGRISVRTRHDPAADEVLVEIADTGAGIDSEVMGRLFDPFFTTKPVGKGTGLGLSLSYSIVQKHNGRIEVESEPGSGTTFTVRIPVRHDSDEEEAAE